MSSCSLRHVFSGSLSFAFLAHTCRTVSATFPATLTTPALYRRSLRWFEVSPLQGDSGGPTSISGVTSFRQVDLLHRPSFSLRGTRPPPNWVCLVSWRPALQCLISLFTNEPQTDSA